VPPEGFSPLAPEEKPPEHLAAQPVKQGRVIVIGNEKGGAGKSTVSMHLSVSLMRMNKKVGIIDLDVRQRTLTRYLENRMRWMQSTGSRLPMPEVIRVDASNQRDLDAAEAEETQRFISSLSRLKQTCDFVIVDAPGGDMNDSFVDFDLLGDVNPQTLEVIRPSFYSEMVWNCRKKKAQTSRKPIDWIVMRNRMSTLAARNKEKVGEALNNLARRIGFRLAPGLSERVIYRELFPSGLTLLDKGHLGELGTSHLVARQELRALLKALHLPEFSRDASQLALA